MIIGDDLKLSGALSELAELPACTSAAHALVRIRAALITDGNRVDKLAVIAAICFEGMAAEEPIPQSNVVPLRAARRA